MGIMKKLTYGVIFLQLLIASLCPTHSAQAVSTTVLISEVYQDGSQEKIEITNNTTDDIDIRNWVLQYTNSSGNSETKFTFTTGIKASGSITLKTASATGENDGVLPGIMSDTTGSLQLKDKDGLTVDTLGWGSSATYKETEPAKKPAAGMSLSRTNNVDTDNNQLDFTSILPNFITGGMVEIVDDLCSNIDGVQAEVPESYVRHNDGTCEQEEAPTTDELMPPYLNEVLADPDKPLVDEKDEFIELYNPNAAAISLQGYQLKVGTKEPYKTFTFTAEHTISAQSYFAIPRELSGVALVNTGSKVQLLAPEGDAVSEVEYPEVDPDQAYAYFADGWRLSDEPTPGAANILKELSEEEVNAAVVATTPECPAGKYRNPATNRCKNLESAVTATVCDEDEYRHPETKRCRKVLAATTVTPCKPGYERHPTTNRCRRIPSAAAALQPCKSGYERNAETNRCRKIGAAQNLMTPAAIQPNGLNFWLAGAGVAAIGGYGIWEWRREIWGITRKLFPQSGGDS